MLHFNKMFYKKSQVKILKNKKKKKKKYIKLSYVYSILGGLFNFVKHIRQRFFFVKLWCYVFPPPFFWARLGAGSK